MGRPEAWPQSLKSVVDLALASPVAMIVLWGPDLVQIYNAAYAVIAGRRHPRGIGQPTRDCWPEVWQFNAPIYDAVWRGEARSFDEQMLTIERHGAPEDAWFDLAYSALRDDAGAIAGVLVTAVETTRQVLAERRIVSQVERQRRMFDQAPGFICISSGPEHVYEFCNEAYERVVGRGDLVGKTVREGLPDIAGQGFYELLDTVYASGERFVAGRMPVRFQHLVGAAIEERYVDFIYEPILDEGGRVTGIFTQGHDVTDAHLAQEQLRDSEARLRELNADLERQVAARTRELSRTWHVSPDPMGILNAEGYFEHSNPAWRTVLGWSPDEIRRTSIFELLHPDDVERTRARFQLLKAGQIVRHFENRYRCKAGGWRWLSWVAAPEGDKFYCSARDVTEDKARAAELQSVEDQLRQAQKMEAVGQLSGGIAHDFNNMLAGMMSGLSIVQRKVAAGKYDDLDRIFDAAQQSGERAASLVKRLLTFSRQQVLKIEAVDASSLALGMGELLHRTLGTNIALRMNLQPDGWAVAADAAQLESALLNLAINSRDAMPDGGELTITTTNVVHGGRDRILPADLPAGDYVALCVGDTGSGMPQDVVDRAFEPFYTTKPIGHGTGLGLSMIYGFARQSHGHVAIASEVGVGTKITLYLPRAVAPVAKAVGPGLRKSPDRRTGQTVLVVDDEPVVRMMITEILSDLGFDWAEAVDADSALSLLRTDRRVDLLVTDIGLPGMNGRQLADAARELRGGLKVLFVTGYAGAAAPDTRALGKDFDLIAKPFGIDAFGDKVLGMSAAASSAV